MSKHSGFDTSTLHAVLSHYDFFNGSVDESVAIPQRLTNLNARLRIGEKQWVIKRYTDSNAPERLALSHQVQRYLTECHFPVAMLEMTREGKTLVPNGQDFYSVHAWVTGRHVDGIKLYLAGHSPDADMIDEIARAVGTYHKLMHGRFLESAPSDATSLIAKVVQQPAGIARRIREKKKKEVFRGLWQKMKPNKSAFERWLEGIDPLLNQADVLALTVATQFSAPNDLIVAHNDLNWENLFFDDTHRLTAIIDFDNVTITHRMLEVGAACIVFAGPNPANQARFIEHYKIASGLDIDPVALNIGVKIKCLRSLLWSIWSYRNGNIVDQEMLAEWCFFLAKCLEDSNRL